MAPQVPNSMSSLASNDEDMLPIPQINAKLYVLHIEIKEKMVGYKIDLRKWYFVLLEKIYCFGVSDHITTAHGVIIRSLLYHFMVCSIDKRMA